MAIAFVRRSNGSQIGANRGAVLDVTRTTPGRETVKLSRRIYCIEGHWDYGKREVEPSVEPILQALQRLGLWDYSRRDCATASELKYWLDNEWDRCEAGSILYLATHGSAGTISLSDHPEGEVSMEQIEAWGVDVGNCLVHFGGCHGLNLDEDRIRRFLETTEASAVSGYLVEGGWTDSAPTLALELMYFASIAERKIELRDGRSAKPGLKRLAEDLRKRFCDCEFVLHTWWD